jgi:spermidine/putrescine-binding protein
MKRAVVLIALLAATLAPHSCGDAQPTTLVVTGYGGRWSEVMKKALVELFEKKHGVKVEIVTGITTEWVAKLLAAGPDNPPYDVVFGNEPAFPIPRERGFFDKRNESLAPNIKNLYAKALIGDTSLAMFWGVYQGETVRYILKNDAGLELMALELGEVRFSAGARVRAGWAAADARIIQEEIGQEETA